MSEDNQENFLEILCKSTGKTWRFPSRTKAEWALEMMNKKLDPEIPRGFVIASIKEGEEEGPVFFGPSSALAIYGKEWKFQTFTEEDLFGRIKSTDTDPDSPEKFVEVKCRRTGKMWRFAARTRTDYALLLMDKSLALGIEAVKEGEEPIKFGPESFLTNYGPGWSLQTIFREGHGQERKILTKGQWNISHDNGLNWETPSNGFLMGEVTPGYILRVLLAFVFIFLLGGLFTFFLEYLPYLLQIVFSPSSRER